MNNFSKACDDVLSTINNLETLLKEGKVSNTTRGYAHLRHANDIHDWLKSKEKDWREIEHFTQEASHAEWQAERVRLNILDINPDDSEEDKRKTYLINAIRRLGTMVTVRRPPVALGRQSKGGYYNALSVLSNGETVIEITIVYPPQERAVLEISTSTNDHATSGKYQVHQDVEKYLLALYEESSITGMVRTDSYPHLDNILNKIAEAVATA